MIILTAKLSSRLCYWLMCASF